MCGVGYGDGLLNLKTDIVFGCAKQEYAVLTRLDEKVTVRFEFAP